MYGKGISKVIEILGIDVELAEEFKGKIKGVIEN